MENEKDHLPEMGEVLALLNEMKKEEESKFSLILDAKEEFMKKLEEEKAHLPYNINLLDEIHANENAHSRILVKLLQYEGMNREYPLLCTFLSYLGSPFTDLALIIAKPEITPENDRIDARIRQGKDFSIIIENKINGAVDQDKQLERYIEHETAYGVKENNIFVVYLTSNGGSPSEGSITLAERKEFGTRYKEISFRSEILPWLRDTALPYINGSKDTTSTDMKLMESAAIQYIDHLEGKFHIRKGEENMKEAMRKLVEEKFNLNKTTSDSNKFSTISDYRNYLQELSSYLDDEERKILFASSKKFKDYIYNIKNSRIKCHSSENEFGDKESTFSIQTSCWNERYSIIFAFDRYFSELFYGIKDSKELTDGSKNPKINELRKILGENDEPNNKYIYSKWIFNDNDYRKLIESFENDGYLHDMEIEIQNLINNQEVERILSN